MDQCLVSGVATNKGLSFALCLVGSPPCQRRGVGVIGHCNSVLGIDHRSRLPKRVTDLIYANLISLSVESQVASLHHLLVIKWSCNGFCQWLWFPVSDMSSIPPIFSCNISVSGSRGVVACMRIVPRETFSTSLGSLWAWFGLKQCSLVDNWLATMNRWHNHGLQTVSHFPLGWSIAAGRPLQYSGYFKGCKQGIIYILYTYYIHSYVLDWIPALYALWANEVIY